MSCFFIPTFIFVSYWNVKANTLERSSWQGYLEMGLSIKNVLANLNLSNLFHFINWNLITDSLNAWLLLIMTYKKCEIYIYTFYLVGKLRYANNSNYKNDTMIRKEVSNFLNDMSKLYICKRFTNEIFKLLLLQFWHFYITVLLTFKNIRSDS